jgi:hypothetical protein|tara:strand:- start:45 stop:266 length:222 start_codon:yes stop_codon:yes gene_type:complete
MTVKELEFLVKKEKKNYKKLNKIHKEKYCLHCGILSGDSKKQIQWELNYIQKEGVCSACDNEDLAQDILQREE